MAAATASELKDKLNQALNKFMLVNGGGKTKALYSISKALRERLGADENKIAVRTLYKWLREETFPANADNIILILSELTGGARESVPQPKPRPRAAEYVPTHMAEMVLGKTEEGITFPVLGDLPKSVASGLVTRIGKVELPAWFVGGRYTDCFGLVIKSIPHGLDARIGDIALFKQGGEIHSEDWIVVEENNRYALKKLNEAVSANHRFTISGVVLSIIHQMR